MPDNLFEQVLLEMLDAGYLSHEDAERVQKSYWLYVEDLRRANRIAAERQAESAVTPAQERAAPETRVPAVPAPGYHVAPAMYAPSGYAPAPPAQPPQPRTREQTREHSLPWILNLGVVRLQLAGGGLAATTWSRIGSPAKTALLFGVSVFFFGVSVLARRVLKIERSAAAFWMTGCLFLPVMLLCVGYFRLLGGYFSLFGEGRWLFGAAGALLCLPVYIYSALRDRSRTFSWFSLTALSLFVAFIVAAFHPPRPVLACALFAFNGLLLLARAKVSAKGPAGLFLRELSVFMQINLPVTLIATMLPFQTGTLYAVDLLLASLLFFGFSHTEGHAVYDYAASAVFAASMAVLGGSLHDECLRLALLAATGVGIGAAALPFAKGSPRRTRYLALSLATGLLVFAYISIFIVPLVHALPVVLTGRGCLLALAAHTALLARLGSLVVAEAFLPLLALVALCEWEFAFVLAGGFPYRAEYLLAVTLSVFVAGYAARRGKRLRAAYFSTLGCTLPAMILTFFVSWTRGVFATPAVVAAFFAAQLFVVWLKTHEQDARTALAFTLPPAVFAALCLIRHSYGLRFLSLPAFCLLCAAAVFLLFALMRGRLSGLRDAFFYEGHALVSATFAVFLLSAPGLAAQTAVSAAMLPLYAFSFFFQRRSGVSHLWLNAFFLMVTVLLFFCSACLQKYAGLSVSKYVLYFNGVLLAPAALLLRGGKHRLSAPIWLSLLCAVLFFGNCFVSGILWYEYLAVVLFCALIAAVLLHAGPEGLAAAPLAVYLSATWLLFRFALPHSLWDLPIALAGAAALQAAGFLRWRMQISERHIDVFSHAAQALLFLLPYQYKELGLPASNASSLRRPAALGSCSTGSVISRTTRAPAIHCSPLPCSGRITASFPRSMRPAGCFGRAFCSRL